MPYSCGKQTKVNEHPETVMDKPVRLSIIFRPLVGVTSLHFILYISFLTFLLCIATVYIIIFLFLNLKNFTFCETSLYTFHIIAVDFLYDMHNLNSCPAIFITTDNFFLYLSKLL